MDAVWCKKLAFSMLCFGTIITMGMLAGWTQQAQYRTGNYTMAGINNRPTLPPPKITTKCVKTVHIFGNDEDIWDIPEIKDIQLLFQQREQSSHSKEVNCISLGYKCNIIFTKGSNIDTDLEGKDAIVFGLVPLGYSKRRPQELKKLLELKPPRGQTWIFFSSESPLRMIRYAGDVNFGRLKYHVIMTYDLDSDIVVPFGYYRPFEKSSVNMSLNETLGEKNLTDPLSGKKGLIAWMVSNCSPFWPRSEFTMKIRDVLPLEDYGACGRKQCLPARSDKCNRLMATYKFLFAMPNSECNDYITEKFWMLSLYYGTVPVVLGARKESYEKVAPPNSYIHLSDFNSTEDFVDYLNRLDKDAKAYHRFYDWRLHGEVVLTFPTSATTFCKAIPYFEEERGENEYKYLYQSSWYNGCRITPNSELFNLSEQANNDLYHQYENWSPWR